MFKKKPTIKPLAPLRSSDRRKLADQIIKDYQLEGQAVGDGATAEEKAEATVQHTSLRNALLPDNTQSARFTTTHGPDLRQVSGTVYVGSHGSEETRILWFEIEKKLYPTVYTLWKNAGIVPLLHTPGIVVQKLKGGADLMTPGLAGGPPFPERAGKGAVVAIASTASPSVPVAVGVCDLDVAGLGSVAGMKGKAVENLHWAGDEVWSFSVNGKSGQEIPEQIVGWTNILLQRGLVEQMEELEVDDNEEAGGVSLDNGANGDSTILTGDASTETDVRELTTKEIDQVFRNAFLYGVHHHMTTNSSSKNFGLMFPLTQSSVMSTLIQPFLPSFTPEEAQQLQIKKSSYKNMKKFVKSLDKEKLVKSKDKDGNETVILDIDFADSSFKDFKPYRLPKKETTAGTAVGRGEHKTEQVDTNDPAVGQTLKVMLYYKPTTKLQPIFDRPAGGDSKQSANHQSFTKSEIRPFVEAYLTAESLVSDTNKRLVKLDPILANAVFDGSSPLDKEVLAKGSVPRDALVDRITAAMQPAYAIVHNPSSTNGTSPPTKTKSGAPPKIKITLETRSGNKTVTKVSGLEPYFVNPRPLADELRKVCAGSTSVEPLAGATKKNEKPVEEVMVQGPQSEAVVKALGKRGVEKRWIEVVDKTKGKKGRG